MSDCQLVARDTTGPLGGVEANWMTCRWGMEGSQDAPFDGEKFSTNHCCRASCSGGSLFTDSLGIVEGNGNTLGEVSWNHSDGDSVC